MTRREGVKSHVTISEWAIARDWKMLRIIRVDGNSFVFFCFALGLLFTILLLFFCLIDQLKQMGIGL
jgi:hypothetical protein